MNTIKRILAFVLCVLLAASPVQFSAYATEVSPTPAITETNSPADDTSPVNTIGEATPMLSSDPVIDMPAIAAPEATVQPSDEIEPSTTPINADEEENSSINISQMTALPLSGILECDRTTAAVGDTITWTITPTGGMAPYKVVSIVTVTFANGSEQEKPVQILAEGPFVYNVQVLVGGVYTISASITDAAGTAFYVSSNSLSKVTVPYDPATQFLSGTVSSDRTVATIGDTITWTISPTGGVAPYKVISMVTIKFPNNSYKDKPIQVKNQGPYTHQVEATESGKYSIAVSIQDATGTSYYVSSASASGVTVYPKATSVTCTPESVSLIVGQKSYLNATILPTDAYQALTYSSSNPQVATVTATGLVQAILAGEATISANTIDGSNLSFEVPVFVSDASPSQKLRAFVHNLGIAYEYSGSYRKGFSFDIGAQFGTEPYSYKVSLYKDGTRLKQAEQTSSGNKIIYVNSFTSGSYQIILEVSDAIGATDTAVLSFTVTGSDFNLSLNTEEDVTPIIKALNITLSSTAKTMFVGDSFQLTHTIQPQNVTNGNVVWESSNPAVATVTQSGLVTALQAGSAQLTVKTADGTNLSASCLITVYNQVSSIAINVPSQSIHVGDTLQLSATVSPSDAVQGVTWEISNPLWASISNSGLLTVWEKGTVTITARATDGSNFYTETAITILPRLVNSIEIICPDVWTANSSYTVLTNVYPYDAENKAISISISDTSIINIVGETLGEALKVGQATITVSATDGSGVSATKTITVKPMLDNDIYFFNPPASIRLKEVKYLPVYSNDASVGSNYLSFSSSNPQVLDIDNTGRLSPVSIGSAVITATMKDGSNRIATCAIAVLNANPDSINLNYKELILGQGQSLDVLKPTVLPNESDQTVKWVSDNPSIVTVDSNGMLTGQSIGNAYIYAVAANDLKAACYVMVVKPSSAITNILLNKNDVAIDEGKNFRLSAKLVPGKALRKTILWSSSDSTIATVDGVGNVRCLTPGTAIITATASNGLSARCTVNVHSLAVAQVVIKKGYLEVDERKGASLSASVLPKNARFKAITWSSSDPSIASVSPKGKITTYKAGTVQITATAHNGVSASCTLVVRSLAVNAIFINKSAYTIRQGRFVTLKATLLPKNTPYKTVTWASSDPSIATVSSKGKVVGVRPGTVTITATAHNGISVTSTITVQ